MYPPGPGRPRVLLCWIDGIFPRCIGTSPLPRVTRRTEMKSGDPCQRDESHARAPLKTGFLKRVIVPLK